LNPIKNILSKIFAIQFYKNNVTLFLLVLAFTGGFMRGSDHVALGTYFVHSTYFLLIPIGVWGAYMMFILASNKTTASKTENTFLSQYWLFSSFAQWKGAFFTVALQMVPVYLYGIFLIALALKEIQNLNIVLLLATITILTVISAWHLRTKLLHPIFENNTSSLSLWVGRNFMRPFFLFAVQGSIKRQFLTISGYKILSLLLLFASIQLCGTDTYDIRMPAIFVIFSFALNIPFVLEYHRFENGSFALYRQMPFSLLRRYGYQLLSISLFTLAEAIMILRNIPLFFPIYSGLLLYIFGLSINVLFYNYLYIKDGPPERKMPFFYSCTILFFIATLADVPLWGMTILNLISSFLLFRGYYYRFEYLSHQTD
jgi:hypothetical protein